MVSIIQRTNSTIAPERECSNGGCSGSHDQTKSPPGPNLQSGSFFLFGWLFIIFP
ncbi:MAG: hypothetical protein ACYSSP_07340 [Planctomycetota bacterium]